MPKSRLSTFVLSVLLIASISPATALATENPPETTPPVAEQQAAAQATPTTVPDNPVRPPLVKLEKQQPLNSFWDKLAICETGGNWKNGGNWAGGLGIARSTWDGFGGRQFARTPDKATREEQIIVANRIAVFGWQTNLYRSTEDRENGKPFFRHAVGFGGWGALECAGGRPPLVKYEESSVIVQKFKRGQRGRLVKDLQAIVGAPLTSVYDIKTWAAHNQYLVNNSLDVSLAPIPRLKQPRSVPSSPDKQCADVVHRALEAGFPKSEIKTIMYVAWKESRCTASAINAKDEHGGSFGLMQINNQWTRRLIRDGVIKHRNDLLHPQRNMEAAFYVWTKNILWSSYGWKAWGLKY